jgi:hypothetical protein
MNLDDIGVSTLKDSTAFKKIQFFSKANSTNLFNAKSDFQNSFNKLNNYYLTDLDLTQSYTYGMDRQHTYTSLSSVLPNFTTLVDNKSTKQFVDYTLGYNPTTPLNTLDTNRLSYNNSGEFQSSTETVTDTINTLFKLRPAYGLNNTDFSTFLKVPNTASVLSAENDSKQYYNSFKFLLNSKFKKKSIQNFNSLLNDNTSTNLLTNDTSNTFSSNLYNTENNLKFKDYKSSNAQFLGSERTVRLLNNISSNSYKWNLSASPNTTSLLSSNLMDYGSAQNSLYMNASSNWADPSKYNRFANNNIWMPSSHAPIMSNNPFFTNTSFDFYEKGKDDSTPMVLRGKEESAPSHVFSTYWSSYWSMSNLSNRFESIFNSNNLVQNFYFPFFTEYAEYDFRNWASIELMEDAFWESSYNSSLQDEYFGVKQNISNSDFLKKQEVVYNTTLRSVKDSKLKSGLLSKVLLSDTNQNSKNLYSLPIFSEDALNNPKFTSLKDFGTFPNELAVDGLDEAYESSKYVNYLYYLNFKNLLNNSTNNIQPLSYTTVFDSFRSDYEDPFLYTDGSVEKHGSLGLNGDEVDPNNNLKLSNPFKVRSTVKNAMVTYNAIQKVFRSRFDEGRSNARLEDFSNSFVKHPYITDSRISYESLLGKNKESFLKTNLYSQSQKLNYSYLSSIFFTNNIYFMDLPFLVYMKSDPSRYLWFDWQSRWSSMEVSASSVSRYSLSGLPYSNKSFEYFTGLGDDLNDSETYLTKLSKARKNYGSNWAFTPYFFSRVSNWYSQDFSTESTSLLNNNLSVRVSLRNSSNYWTNTSFSSVKYTPFTPTFADVNSPARKSWQPYAGPEFFRYSESILADILSKREYLYRHYFSSKGFKAILPDHFRATPNHPLLSELKDLSPFVDSVMLSSESTRDMTYYRSSLFNTSLLHTFLNYFNYNSNGLPLNLNLLNTYFLTYFTSFSQVNNLSNDYELLRNQYRPMRKGVSNMVKLHATGAVAMPIETRLHILASSKDVIHSWAIPSAGIKIDCVPGYSSHRIMIFLVSGIFWGQCMEICGRFHHWMPIIVFFLKRDLFFLWCTNFMHFSPTNNDFSMSDRQLCDSLKPATFSQSGWVADINTSL